jgi:hypothetical protein
MYEHAYRLKSYELLAEMAATIKARQAKRWYGSLIREKQVAA